MLTTKNTHILLNIHWMSYKRYFKISDRYSNALMGNLYIKLRITPAPGETFRNIPNENICYANFKEYLSGENKIDDLIEVQPR